MKKRLFVALALLATVVGLAFAAEIGDSCRTYSNAPGKGLIVTVDNTKDIITIRNSSKNNVYIYRFEINDGYVTVKEPPVGKEILGGNSIPVKFSTGQHNLSDKDIIVEASVCD